MPPKSCSSCSGGAQLPLPLFSQDKSVDTEILLGKVAMCSVLAYMLYIGATCPCKPLYKCHLSEMYVAVGAVVAILVYFNGLSVKSIAHK